uniref:p11 protein n=1 Tax=Blueberry virus A TaxID=1206566 RepID=T1YUX1_9CLOS|nr:p11 protein [Blueberry virus A]
MKRKEISENASLELRERLMKRRESNRLSSLRSRVRLKLRHENAMKEIENLKNLNSSLMMELNEVMTNFISINEENKMLLIQVSELERLLLYY